MSTAASNVEVVSTGFYGAEAGRVAKAALRLMGDGRVAEAMGLLAGLDADMVDLGRDGLEFLARLDGKLAPIAGSPFSTTPA